MTDRELLRRYLDRTRHLEHPLEALEAVRELRRHLSEVERSALTAARSKGISVNDCAQALGMTRQAVYYKYNQLEGARAGQPDEIVAIPEAEEPHPAGRSPRSPA